jgi:uncharacterized protein (TIGR02246 family)
MIKEMMMLKESAVATTTREADGSAIYQIIQQIEEAWNIGDGPASARPFTQDVDYMVWNGMHVKGRQALAAGHQEIFDTFYKGSVIRYQIKSIRFLRDDVAVVHVEAVLQVPQDSGGFTEIKAVPVFIMTKDNGDWQVDVFQNTLVQSQSNQPVN